jgi:hypothetical protein
MLNIKSLIEFRLLKSVQSYFKLASSKMEVIENLEYANKENTFCFNKQPQDEQAKHEEYQYLDKIKEIIRFGKTRIDRTNIGTKSVFGTQSRYSLRNSIHLFC